MFTQSQRQLDIENTWINEDCNIAVGACAGSGKTTTLLELLKVCTKKTLFLAFNKSIQEDIQNKIEIRNLKQGKAITLHSLGLLAIRTSGIKFVINNSKNYELIKQLQFTEHRIFKKMSWENKIKYTYTLIDMNDISRMFLTDDMEIIKEHFLNMDKIIIKHDDLQYIWEKFLIIRKESYEKEVLNIDFNDMIYLPVLKNYNIPLNPSYLFIDECQDLSTAQHALVNNLISQGDILKWIAVGDKNQSIYGFSGSSSKSFDAFLNKENVKELPLDICYRCDINIVSKANEVYNVMHAHKTTLGTVDTIYDANLIKNNSMVICRNSSPLINLYFELLSLDKNVYIKGEEILTSLIKFMKPYEKFTVESALIEMNYKLEDLEQDTSDNGKFKTYLHKEDLSKCTKLIKNLAFKNEMISSLMIKTKNLFADKKDAIMLCTIHKSKGLESDVVYILNENLIPSKFAKSEEQLIQEKNLKYVARTRAKKELYFLNL